jgi:hypothetical protein
MAAPGVLRPEGGWAVPSPGWTEADGAVRWFVACAPVPGLRPERVVLVANPAGRVAALVGATGGKDRGTGRYQGFLPLCSW